MYGIGTRDAASPSISSQSIVFVTGTGVGVVHPMQKEHPLVGTELVVCPTEVLVVVGQCFGVLVITVVFLFLMVLVIVIGGHVGLGIGHLHEKPSV